MNPSRRYLGAIVLLLAVCAMPLAQTPRKVSAITGKEFEIIEGVFHDGLGTFAELTLANRLIQSAGNKQAEFDLSRSEAKMSEAIERLPADHPARARFEKEKANVVASIDRGAKQLIERAKPNSIIQIRHTAREFADAKAADIVLELSNNSRLPVSVKTEKSNKLAVAEGQTPDIAAKWAERYFRVSPSEFDSMLRELGVASMAGIKSNYLNVARLVAIILIRKLGLIDCEPNDFGRARVTDPDAAKFLFKQLLRFKHGNDSSTVIIFDRATGAVGWESKLDAIDVDRLTADRISFRPSRPRAGRPIASEFGIKIDGRVVVTFQIKHKRGSARGTIRQFEFSDITTRLMM